MGGDDEQLVRAHLDGDRRALAAIYDRYADELHNFAWGMLRNADDAADVTHDAFVLASQRLDQLRDPTKLRAWLFSIVRNETRRRGRARTRLQPTEAVQDMAAEGPEPEAGIHGDELRDLVWAAAEGLDERDRELLELTVRNGLGGDELAQAMGVTTSHVYVMTQRMRERVERSLGALLVARRGSDDCDELARLLRDWDGTFTVKLRKRVARHIDDCDLCTRRKGAMASPLALLGAVPLMPAPALLRDRVLASTEAAAAAPLDGGAPIAGTRVATMGGRRRRSVLVGAAAATVAAIVAAVAVLAGLLASEDDPDRSDVLAAEVVSSSTTSGSATTAPAPTSGPSTTDEAAPTAVAAPATTVAAAVSVPPTVTVAPTAPTTDPTVPPPPPGQLEWSTEVIDVGDTATSGGIVLANTGGSPVTWQAAGGPSAAVQPAGGTLAPGSSVAATVVVDRSSLAEGPFTLPLSVSSNGGSTTVDVVGSVIEPPELIRVSRAVGDVAVAAPGCLGSTTSRVAVAAEDDSGIGGGTLSWVHSDGSSGNSAFVVVDGGLVARLGPFDAEGTVTWSVEVRDTFGNVTTQAGTPSLPVVCETGGFTTG